VAVKKKKIKIDEDSLVDFLSRLEDPRIDRTKRHDLIDILVIAICAVICGAKTWIDIEDFGESKLDWFKRFLNLQYGIPSHDTFRRVFMILNPEEFSAIFIQWVQSVTKDEDIKQICIDGKTLRKSFKKGKASSALHMINAWSTGASLALGQMKSEGKKNEIKTVPKLIDRLDIKGHIVSTDAMSCQVVTAKKIIDKEGDYLLAVKSNQKTIYNRVKKAFEDLSKPGPKVVETDSYNTQNEGHGRIEKRSCRVITQKDSKCWGINPFEKWPSLNALIEIKNERVCKVTGKITEQTRYYISSCKDNAEYLLQAVRGHWEVENKLHWVLDVIFREDDNRSRSGYSPENFSMLRQFALNLIKLEPTKKSIRRKQNIAGWVDDYLLTILLGGANLDA
jgi:predicted transposase YbfD/YdcC